MKIKLANFAIMGNPIAHSKSPMLHEFFTEQLGVKLQYEALLVPLTGFADALIAFQQHGGRGLNVTLPFKQQAFVLMDRLSPAAQLAGAVNTILFQTAGQRYGENTDGIGFVRDLLDNHHGKIENQKILILGAGGAVRGIMGPLLELKPELVVIANRTLKRAQSVAHDFSHLGNIQVSSYEELTQGSFDLIINATSASLQNQNLPISTQVLANNPWCYDMVYGEEPTTFLHWAERHGAAKCIDGLGMLVEQAAESFYLWHQVRPNTAPILAQLRQYGLNHQPKEVVRDVFA